MTEKRNKTTPLHKEGLRKEFVDAMKKDGAPEEVIDLWGVQGGLCYSAFLTGKMAAKLMVLDGDITEDQVVEVAMEWAKLLVMKISYKPPTQRTSDLVIAKTQGAPGRFN